MQYEQPHTDLERITKLEVILEIIQQDNKRLWKVIESHDEQHSKNFWRLLAIVFRLAAIVVPIAVLVLQLRL